ncbi:hypothetical protein MKW92_005950 [Papaver armeniacum]|nr:hypothetical protein MKW92_005950 [Papaver armeniacum]
MVTLSSSDGVPFDVEEAVALQSQTIKHMIEDGCADNGIPLTNVTSNILAKVLEYCKKHVGDIPKGNDGKVEDLELQKWDAEFVEVDQDTLLDLILAANYLNIKHLLNLTCQTVADRQNHVIPACASIAELMKQCEQLLRRLMEHPYGFVFNAPVDILKLNIPDYFKRIKHPMDLGTVKSKIANGEYSCPLKFGDDVRLTFSNAMTYNPPGHHVHTMAGKLRNFFEARWKAIENKFLPVPVETDDDRDTEPDESIPPSKKMKISSPGHEREMTVTEQFKLINDLQSIREFPSYLIEFLAKQRTRHTADGELEVDLQMMTGDALFTLRKLVDDYTKENQRKAN